MSGIYQLDAQSPGRDISRRLALGYAALAVAALAACELPVDPVIEEGRLLAALQHRGGIERFALRHLSDDVEVKVDQTGQKLHVTVFQVDPATREIQGVLEEHRNRSNKNIAHINSDHVEFGYVY